jgi:hypothetical protein
MRLVEFEVSSVNTEKLAALSQFLLSRAQDTDAEKKISIAAFVDLAKNVGVSLNDAQLRNLVQQAPLKELIADVTDTEVIFKGAVEGAPNMTVDQARETVNTMAQRALNKKGL